MARFDRLRDAAKLIQKAAIQRFQARTEERNHNKALISAGGPGAADSQERREKYRNRMAGMNMLRASAAHGKLGFGIERKMGATLDFISLAPSDLARKAGQPVGRLFEFAGAGIEPQAFATGFLVAPEMLMTNWHVFPSRSDARGCAVNFGYEATERGIQRGMVFELDVDRFFVSEERLDFAIVAVKPRSLTDDALADLGQNTLIEATPKIMKGEAVNIIQYPEGGAKQYAISQNRLVDILDAEGFLQYETDTLQGSSGSPAFSDNWELIALHHASIPLMRDGHVVARNGGLWNEGMGDDEVKWLANEGTRVSAMVAELAKTTLENPAEAALLKALLATTTDPVADAMARGTPNPGQESAVARIIPSTIDLSARYGHMSGLQFVFTGPVTININTSDAMPPTPVQPLQTAIKPLAALEKSIRFDPDYDNREGYAPDFLGGDAATMVPVPRIKPEKLNDMLMGDDAQPLLLKYHHFELMMNRKRRLQMWSAVNIDYDPRKKSQRNREEFGRDQWIGDPRIPESAQILDADFYKPAGNIDRGHIVRREDNAWGIGEEAIEYANSDTFHFTNCTPQHEAFNQSNPGMNDKTYKGMEGIWGAFENLIQTSRKDGDTKACILSGPILADNDPSHDFGKGAIQYPLEFWKIVCIADGSDDNKLKVYGFILGQEDVVGRFGIERFAPGRFGRFQRPLSEIGAATGLIFDDLLMNADTKRDGMV